MNTLINFPPQAQKSRVFELLGTHVKTGKTLRIVRKDVNAALRSAQLMIDCGYHVHVGFERGVK